MIKMNKQQINKVIYLTTKLLTEDTETITTITIREKDELINRLYLYKHYNFFKIIKTERLEELLQKVLKCVNLQNVQIMDELNKNIYGGRK